jgi:hypothetical protein
MTRRALSIGIGIGHGVKAMVRGITILSVHLIQALFSERHRSLHIKIKEISRPLRISNPVETSRLPKRAPSQLVICAAVRADFRPEMAAGGPRRVSHSAQTSRRTQGSRTARTRIWRVSTQYVDHGVQVSSDFLKRAARGDAEAEVVWAV